MSDSPLEVTTQTDVTAEPTTSPTPEAPASSTSPAQPVAGSQKGWKERREAFAKDPAEPSPEGSQEPAKDPDKPDDPAEEKKDKFAPRFAALVKREATVRQREEQLKSRASELEVKAKEYDELKQLLGKDPLTGLQKLGYSFSDLTRIFLQADAPPDPRELVEQTKEELRKEMEAKLQAEKEKDALAKAEMERNHSLGRFAAEVSEELQTGAFPYLAAENRTHVLDAVLKHMTAVHQSSGKVLTYDEACTYLENQLKTHYQSKASIGNQVQQQPSTGVKGASQVDETNVGHKDRHSPKTLSNTHAQESGPAQKLDWKERRKRFVQS